MFKFEDIFVDCYVHYNQVGQMRACLIWMVSSWRLYFQQVEDEQQVLDRITEISTLIFAMLTVITRSSRSYSIGLQNSDLEAS